MGALVLGHQLPAAILLSHVDVPFWVVGHRPWGGCSLTPALSQREREHPPHDPRSALVVAERVGWPRPHHLPDDLLERCIVVEAEEDRPVPVLGRLQRERL